LNAGEEGEESESASLSLKAATRLVAPTISPRILIEVEVVKEEVSEVDAVFRLSIFTYFDSFIENIVSKLFSSI
jgi:hypothetical protein